MLSMFKGKNISVTRIYKISQLWWNFKNLCQFFQFLLGILQNFEPTLVIFYLAIWQIFTDVVFQVLIKKPSYLVTLLKIKFVIWQ